MAGGWYFAPVGDTERNVVNIHVVILYELLKKAPCGAFFGMVNQRLVIVKQALF